MKLKDRFAAFMYGRNGNDEFYTFLMWVALALLIVAWIFMIAGLHVVYIILYALDLLILWYGRHIFRLWYISCPFPDGGEDSLSSYLPPALLG